MTYAITVCPGPKSNPVGRRHPIDPSCPVESLAALLNSAPTSTESWWSVHLWTDDRRAKDNWVGAVGVAIDVDYVDAAGQHATATAEDAARFRAATSSLPGTHWHSTPRGSRVVVVFPAPVVDREAWAKAAAGFASLVETWIRVSRLDADRTARLPGYEIDDNFLDLARFMYCPRALVSGIQRSAAIVALRPLPVDPAELAKSAPKPAPAATPKPAPGVIRSPTASARFQDAAAAYNRDATRDWGRSGSCKCPVCPGEHGAKSFGAFKSDPTRWSCFSTGHPDCGHKAGLVAVGDALDLDAFVAGKSPADFLRARGYLAERGVAVAPFTFPEPPPPGDEDLPPEAYLSGGVHLSLVPPPGSAPPARPEPPDPDEGKERIRVSTDEEHVNDRAIECLSKDKRVYQRGRALVQVLRGINALRGVSRSPEALTISELPLPRLRELLATAAIWETFDVKATEKAERAAVATATGTDDGAPAAATPGGKKVRVMKRTHPPDWVVRAVAARGRWDGVRPLTGITEWPILRSDGTVLADPGYDPRTGLVYEPAGPVDPIPQEPCGEEVAASLDLLREAVCDFPFANEAAFSAWLAGLLTPLARYAFEGPAPLFMAEANTRGSGKTRLWELASTILSTRALASTPYSEDDEEMGKKITSCAMAGDPLIFLDNVSDKFGGGRLDQALTGRVWRDRILGRSENTPELPLTAVWYATGNNLAYVGDIDRRLCVCALQSPLENPESRSDFKHPDLLDWARRERRRLVSAGLLILRAFACAGSPRGKWTLWGSFEGWSRTVKACLEWLQLPEPPTPRTGGAQTTELQEIAITHEALRRLDPSQVGMTASQLVHEIAHELEAARRESRPADEAIQALTDVLGKASLDPKRLGYKLRRWKGRVVAGFALRTHGEDRLSGTRWICAGALLGANGEVLGASLDKAPAQVDAFDEDQESRGDPRIPD